MFRKVVWLVLVLVFVGVAGCGEMTFKERMEAAQQVQEFAKESGADYSMEFRFGGKPGFEAVESVRFNTDATLVISVHGRAGAELAEEVVRGTSGDSP